MTMRPIALDAMGGDNAPAAIVAGASRAVRAGIPVILVGDKAVIKPHLPKGSKIKRGRRGHALDEGCHLHSKAFKVQCCFQHL